MKLAIAVVKWLRAVVNDCCCAWVNIMFSVG